MDIKNTERAATCKELATIIRNALKTASELGVSIHDDGDYDLVMTDIYYDEGTNELYFTVEEVTK